MNCQRLLQIVTVVLDGGEVSRFGTLTTMPGEAGPLQLKISV